MDFVCQDIEQLKERMRGLPVSQRALLSIYKIGKPQPFIFIEISIFLHVKSVEEMFMWPFIYSSQ